MLCPNCKRKLKNNCCIKCGYMTNGNNIKLKYKNEEKFKDLKLYNEKFEIYYRNENYIWPLLIGPLYLMYRGYIILGTIISLIDIWIITSIMQATSYPIIGGFCIYLLIFYVIVSRLINGSTFNALCLFLDKIKIKYIKNKYPKDYQKKLLKHKNSIINILIPFLEVVIIMFISLLIRKIENGTIADWFI